MAEIIDMSAGEITLSIASGTISAKEVMLAFLAQVESLNHAVNAICTLNPSALAEASETDGRRSRGEKPRLLEGVPFLVKDNIETKGLRTTYGSAFFRDHVPVGDALSVARLKAHGALLIGKTNTPEFAADINTTNVLFGTTRNPWDLNVTPGGSSGGTSAALAAGMAPIGLGTDLGGSIRLPASYTGTVGLRPSQGRVPVFPSEFAWDTLVAHVQGPMARTVSDTGRMLQALAGPDDLDPVSLPAQGQDYVRASSGTTAVAYRRFAFSRDLNGVVPLDGEVDALTEAAARRFEAFGCTVEEEGFDTADLREIMSGTRAFNMVARHADRYDRHAADLSFALAKQVGDALKVELRTVTRAERLRTAYWHRVRSLLERFDYIVTPTVGAPPFRLDEPLPLAVGGKFVQRYYDVCLAVYAFSITNVLPSISVPCGWTQGGLPVGLQIVGRRYREDMVLEAAAAFAESAPEFFRRPHVDPSTLRPVSEALSTPGIKIG